RRQVLQVLQSLGCHSSPTFSYFCFTAAQATLWATSSSDSLPRRLARVLVFLPSAIESLAINVLRVTRERVLDAFGKLSVGPIRHWAFRSFATSSDIKTFVLPPRFLSGSHPAPKAPAHTIPC